MRNPSVTQAIAHCTGRTVKTLRPIVGEGYTDAHRFIAVLDNSQTVFVKQATDTFTSKKLRDEYHFHCVQEATFIPKGIGWYEAPLPLFVRESVSGSWPPPWSDDMVEAFIKLLDLKDTLQASTALPTVQEVQSFKVWDKIIRHPDRYRELTGLDDNKFSIFAKSMLKIEETAQLEGDQLLHLDLRGDNICFTQQGINLIDWDHGCRGNGQIDRCMWLVALSLESGKTWGMDAIIDLPILVTITGFFLYSAMQPAPLGVHGTIRQLQHKQASVALAWLRQRGIGLD